jgi:hypothetical protein
MPTPWDRLPGESAKAYRAFGLYRDLGARRSLNETSRIYHSAPQESPERPREASGQIRLWANRWSWNARVEAWDQQLEQVKRSKLIEAVEEMADRHVKEAMMLQNKAVERLRQLRPEELKPREILDYLIEAAKLERLARGEPTERIAEEHRFPNIKELTDEELAAIVARGQELSPASGRGTPEAQEGPPQLL